MQVTPVNRVVDKKRIIGKMEGRGGGGEAQRAADPPKNLPTGSFRRISFIFWQVRSSVAYTIAAIAQWDFPDEWPELGPILQNCRFGRKLFGLIFILIFWTNFHIKFIFNDRLLVLKNISKPYKP
jgi:hypothetical protein